MQFTIRNKAANKYWMTWQILNDARTVLLFYKVKPSEHKLNKYLLEHYNLSLIETAIYLLKNCKAFRSLDNSVTIMFPDKEDDKLASFITYGNLEIPGSNILKEAFFRKE